MLGLLSDVLNEVAHLAVVAVIRLSFWQGDPNQTVEIDEDPHFKVLKFSMQINEGNCDQFEVNGSFLNEEQAQLFIHERLFPELKS